MNQNKINESFHWAWILKLEIFLLFFSIALGYILYSGSLGWGDSLNQLSRPLSIPEFIYSWWHELNGRMGQAVLYAVALLPLRWLSPTPDSFPWWILRSADIFCILSAPLLMVAALQNEILPRKLTYRGLLIFSVWVVWTFNPRVSETSTWFSAADLVGYSGPIFIISLIFFLLSKGNLSLLTKKHMLLGLLLSSFFIAILGEQYLLAFPVLVLGIALVNVAKGSISYASAAKLGITSALGSVLGFALYWAAPAQQKRNVILELHVSNLWEVYDKSISYGYMFLFHVPDSFGKLAHAILIAGHTTLLIAAIRLAVWDLRNDNARYPPALRGLGVTLATLLMAYHACFSTLIISNYFPGWAGMFPGLLLVMALLVAFLMLAQFIVIKDFASKLSKYVGVIIGFFALMGLIYLANAEYHRYIEMAKQANENNQYRRMSYARILSEASHAHSSSFVLINCPLAVPQYGWSMEAPWGISAYFNWSGSPSLKVFLQGNPDFPENWSDGSYKIIDCSAS